ncbi:MAG: hypothetical protein KF893_22530 [Caldilineaceae bacterium]|nr:hypothetical protein [Caldilineaceae bacterium]
MARQILPNDSQQDSVLMRVHEGMDVYNYDDERIGKVESIFFGSVSPEEAATGTGAATADNPAMRERGFLDDLANVFRDDNLPDELRERLLRKGFIRIDSSGLFSSDRYAMPEQIAAVHEDRVILRTDKEGLIKR